MRNGKYETITFSSDVCASVERFLIFDIALGHNTHVVYSKEISKEDFVDLNRVLLK